MLKMPEGQQSVDSTAVLWPMPLPFPDVFLKGRDGLDCELRRAVNLEVASLNWIFLGRPRCCPDAIRLGVKLNRQQLKVVDRFIRLSSGWENFPVIEPSDMGRGASKHEALEEVLNTLETVASECNLHLGYQRSKLRSMPKVQEPAEPIARLQTSNLEIVADRIKMEGEPTFDPLPYLDTRSKILYQDPVGQALDPSEVDVPFPVVKVHATHREKMQLLHKLDRTNRLTIATADQVREFAPNGLFSVIKDLQFDRMILDARRPNLLQPPLNRWILSMASASNLLDLSLEPEEDLVMGGDDLVDYYYKFIVGDARAHRNFLVGSMTGREAKKFKACPKDIPDDVAYACLRSLAMGDCSACEFAQTAHLSLGIRSGAFTLQQLLTLRGRVPRDRFITGIIIDDLVYMEKVERSQRE